MCTTLKKQRPAFMSVHMRPRFSLLRPHSVLELRTLATGKTLPSHSTAFLHRSGRSLPRTQYMLVTGAVLSASISCFFKDSALCQNAKLLAAGEGASGSSSSNKKDDQPMETIIDLVLANCGELTLAGSLGFCSGYALKQVGKTAALAVGLVFIIAQTAAYYGYVDIKWGKVQKDVIAKVDPNGDGKIDSKDVKLWYQRLVKIMKLNLPSSAGFSSGFALGICYS
ncbi:hypothetical protein PsorP6_013433 [Peronosclerospora sorghi]|uniref:Uncharacterized protein n=1 Tax=Peronosclerospora sorghi TaxID=230839 RepID=A0ACC0VG64_9STRA|nr:hypothetical protein PsorP6_013433 [Peronosclerospora sorghi]